MPFFLRQVFFLLFSDLASTSQKRRGREKKIKNNNNKKRRKNNQSWEERSYEKNVYKKDEKLGIITAKAINNTYIRDTYIIGNEI